MEIVDSSVAAPLGLMPKPEAAKALMNGRYSSFIPLSLAVAVTHVSIALFYNLLPL